MRTSNYFENFICKHTTTTSAALPPPPPPPSPVRQTKSSASFACPLKHGDAALLVPIATLIKMLFSATLAHVRLSQMLSVVSASVQKHNCTQRVGYVLGTKRQEKTTFSRPLSLRSVFPSSHLPSFLKYSGTSNNGHCRGI